MRIPEERVREFEDFLDAARDEDGLVYSDIKADERRRWRNEDLDGKGYDIWENWAHDPAGCAVYEDCIMATGRYVCAMILRHLASGGDPTALAHAERSVNAILALSRQGDRIEDGFLPKPFGGLAKASLSANTSNDQYEHALFALWDFREACPESPLVPDIESAIRRWTDYFIRRDFSYVFHGYQWICIDPVPEKDGLPAAVGRHTLGLYLPMCVMCREITHDPTYDHLIQNRLLPSLRRFLQDPKLGFSGHSNSCNLMAMGMYFCLTRHTIEDEAVRALKLCWDIATSRLSRSDGLEYEYAHFGASDDHPLQPHYLEDVQLYAGWKFEKWVSNVKTASSTKTAHTGVLLQRIDPDPAREAVIDRILAHFTKPEDFLRWVDPDGTQTCPEQAWLANSIPAQFVGAWLQAFYLRRLPPSLARM